MREMNKVKKALRYAVYMLFCLSVFTALIYMQGAKGGTMTAWGAQGNGGAAAESASGGIAMEVEYGYGDTAKGNRYIPIYIKLENSSDAFEGTLQILSQESDYTVYQYEYPVSIAAGETQDKSMNIPLAAKSDQLYITLLDSAGSQTVRKRLKLNVNKDVTELFVGVLSDNPAGLSFLDGVGLYYSTLRIKMLELTEKTFPEDSMKLDLLDVIIINDYNAERLSDLQKTVLIDWVRQGGSLLVGTGARVNQTFGWLEDELLDSPYSAPRLREVDFGVEYASSSPGDSMVSLFCVEDLKIKGGNDVLTSDDLALVSSVYYERGSIGVASYDLSDIADFCGQQPSYVGRLFTAILGESKIQQLSDINQLGTSTEYWNVQNMINTGNVDSLPKIWVYAAVVILYICFAGPGLYALLKKYQLHNLYRRSVVMVSVVFAVLIYLIGGSTRLHAAFFSYATIKEVSEKSISESTYINVRAPYNKPYSVQVDDSYSLLPITQNRYYSMMESIPKFTGEEGYQVSIHYGEEKNSIQVRDSVAFTPKYFRMDKKTDNETGEYLSGSIAVSDGKAYGTVTNHYDAAIENAAVLMYGQMVILGTMEAGESREFNGQPVICYPVNNSYVVAQNLSGCDQFEKVDINDRDYLKALERSNILSFYMNAYFSTYTQGAKIIGFELDKARPSFIGDGINEVFGITMVSSDIQVEETHNGRVNRLAYNKAPKVVSGSYTASVNQMYGVDPLILEYYLGSDIDVEQLRFNRISDVFLKNEDYYYLTPFGGIMYFYNYNTGMYDRMDYSRGTFNSRELEAYLSPSNAITVKYVLEDSSGYQWNVTLPLLSVSGREK